MNIMNDDFSRLVAALIKPGENIIRDLTPVQADLTHVALGLSGEVGELVSAITKHVIHQKQLDFDNVIEEIGDIEFFLERLRQLLTVTRDHPRKACETKLLVRYPSGKYSQKDAIEKRDKNG